MRTGVRTTKGGIDGGAGLDCNEIVELVTDHLEGAMDPRTADTFEQHLTICDGCHRYVAQVRETIDTSGAIPVSGPSPQAEEALLDACRSLRRPG